MVKTWWCWWETKDKLLLSKMR